MSNPERPTSDRENAVGGRLRAASADAPSSFSRRALLRAATGAAAGAAAPLATTGVAGQSSSPPAESDPSRLFRTDFESVEPGDYVAASEHWGGHALAGAGEKPHLSVVEADGDRVLDASFPAGVEGAGNGNGGGDFKVDLGGVHDELSLAYRVKLGEGFEFDQPGGKLPGLIGTTEAGGYAITGGDDPDGENGWSARMMWRDPEADDADGAVAMFYTYHPDMPGEYGENMLWDDGPSGQAYFRPGEWHRVEHRVVMNTPGEADGILEGWFDGEKAFERRDLRFRDVPELGIDDFYFSCFFGGGQTEHWAHTREEHVYFDDFVVATEPIWLDDDAPPPVPVDLAATAVGSTSVDLSWAAVADDGPAGVAAYRVAVDGRHRETVPAGTTDATVEGITAGAVHEVAVTAVDAAGNASAPATATVETSPLDDGSPPPAPTDLRETDRGLREVALAWSDVTDAEAGIAHYEVVVDGSVAARTDGTAHVLGGLDPGSQQRVAVRAVDLAGNASEPATASVATLPLSAGDGALVVNDFDGDSAWPGGNDLGGWAGAGDFENDQGAVVDGALRLEYAAAGWLKTDVGRDVSAHEYLTLVLAGDRGGEEDDVAVEVGGLAEPLTVLSDDAVGARPTAVRIDLDEAGIADAPDAIRLSFTEGGSGAVEIHEIRFDGDHGGGDAGPPSVGENDAAPTDPDDDGLYEDVNGNGGGDLADAVDLYQHRDSGAVQNDVDAYDFSGNEEIDLADVVQLYQENTG